MDLKIDRKSIGSPMDFYSLWFPSLAVPTFCMCSGLKCLRRVRNPDQEEQQTNVLSPKQEEGKVKGGLRAESIRARSGWTFSHGSGVRIKRRGQALFASFERPHHRPCWLIKALREKGQREGSSVADPFWIRMWIHFRYGCGSGSCYFHHWPSRR